MKMKILDLTQGSPEWHAARKEHFCASDAPAMMGASKYKSRKQLLHEKKTGQTKPVDSFTQKRFDAGHATEASARDIVEMNEAETFTPVVGMVKIKTLKLLASLDGLNDSGEIALEHKLFNKILSLNVENGVLEPMHYWQLEQQLLVSGAKKVLFVCSDGTEDKWHEMFYVSIPERREQLLAGWVQFNKDLKAFKVEAKTEAVVATVAEAFPLIKYKIEGSMIVSNISAALPIIKERADVEMNRILETDQDFADKEDLNKATVKARATLKEVVSNVTGEYVSYSEFTSTAAQIDSILQKMQSQGEKQVKDAKQRKKDEIKETGLSSLRKFSDECYEKIKPLSLSQIGIIISPDFDTAMKGKRNLESLQSAVDDVVAKQKIWIGEIMARIVPNQIFMREHGSDFKFLFHDVAQIINQETEPFQAVVKSRIADHEKKEEEKAKALRESIRKEEEEKANKKIEPVAEENSTEDVSSPSVETAKTPQQRTSSTGRSAGPAPDPFKADMTAWAKKYNVPTQGIEELSAILKKHGV